MAKWYLYQTKVIDKDKINQQKGLTSKSKKDSLLEKIHIGSTSEMVGKDVYPPNSEEALNK